MKTVAFVPIRLNSKRVVGKNMKLIAGRPLLYYILKTLTQVKNIDEIYAYCSSEEIIPELPSGVKFLKRSKDLDQDTTLGQEIYDAFTNEIDADVYVLAHTTSPFIKVSTIETAVQKVLTEGYDSSFSAEKKQTFAWYDGKPLNYSLTAIPRTQDISPVYIETSAFFIFKKEIWTKKHQRIGDHPYISVVDQIEGIDIDNIEDFDFAQQMADKLKL